MLDAGSGHRCLSVQRHVPAFRSVIVVVCVGVGEVVEGGRLQSGRVVHGHVE